MKVLIIDQREDVRNHIEHVILKINDKSLEVFKTDTMHTGFCFIKEINPELVFFNISIFEKADFDTLRLFEQQKYDFHTVFVGNEDSHSHIFKILKFANVFHLSTPLDSQRIFDILNRCIELFENKTLTKKLENLQNTFQNSMLNTLPLEVSKGIVFISYDDILYFEADGMYTKIYMTDGEIELVSKPLKHFFDQLLGNTFFYKCHRSYIVNLKSIKKFLKQDGGYLIMSNSKNIPIAKNKKQDFLYRIQKMY